MIKKPCLHNARAEEANQWARRRQNIQACLDYVVKNGYPRPDEVFVALDGAIEHLTMDGFLAIDWTWLTARGRPRKDEAFVLVSCRVP